MTAGHPQPDLTGGSPECTNRWAFTGCRGRSLIVPENFSSEGRRFDSGQAHHHLHRRPDDRVESRRG